MMASASPATNQAIKIDIVSEMMCPFCFVGKRKLEAGIQQFQAEHPNTMVDVHWHPFFMYTDDKKWNPMNGMNKRESYNLRTQDYPPHARAHSLGHPQMEARVKAVGHECGIQFSYGGRTGNTIRAHTLVGWARTQGGSSAQNAVVEALMHGYFELEQDITCMDFLRSAAASAGLDPNAAAAHIQACEANNFAQVRAEVASWRNRYNILGVPFFLVNGRLAVSGARSPLTFKVALEQALDMEYRPGST